jgi:hypothetical protein
LTAPFPLPLAPEVTVIQLELLTPVQPQPLPAVTATLPVPPLAARLCEVGDALKLHPAVKVKVFDSALGERPPGPTAATSATYTVPTTGHPTNIDVKST